MQKILVIQTAFIGDVVLATALLEKLHHFYPEAEIDFLLRKGNESLLDNHPFLHEVLIWDKKNNKYRNLFRLLSVIRHRKYDKVINLQRFVATGFITALSGAKEKIGFDKNPFSFLFDKKIKHEIGTGKHEVERNLQLISDCTDATTFFKPRLYPSAKDVAAMVQYKKRPYCCIAPASVWFTKQYPVQQWIDFINLLQGDLLVYLLGGPGDRSLCEKIRETSFHQGIRNLAGELTFLQSATLMEDAKMNYVNDSAPLHFASAMNANTTAIFCSTVPAFGYGPLSTISHIVETKKPLTCRPCGLHGHKICPQTHFKCATTIQPEQLKATLP